MTTVPAEAPAKARRAATAPRGRLNDREWFGFHVMAFGIGSWNLFAIDFARGPQEWWFWMPVAAWSAALSVHAIWLFALRPAGVAPLRVLRRSEAGR